MKQILFFINLIVFIDGSIYKNLKYFETLHADDLEHKIVKRGLKESNHKYNKIKELNFRTLGKDFRLILTPKKDVLHARFKAYAVDGDGKEATVHVDHDSFFDGRVFGEKVSDVSLHIDDGVLTGSIYLPDETYHLEPSWRHLADSDNRTTIAYRSSDVKLSWDPQNYGPEEFAPKTCGYVKEGLELETDDDDEAEKGRWLSDAHRERRQIDQYEYTPTKTRCPLLLVADYRFFQEMGGSNTKTTINYLISLIDRVHKIYNDTIWQDRHEIEGFKGMGFVIKKIVVHNEPTRIRQGDAHYNMVREKWDVRTLLEVFSRQRSNKEFCLAHLFTYQTFRTHSVLGLAYIASPRPYSHGGICTAGFFFNRSPVSGTNGDTFLVQVFSREYTHKDFCLAHLFTDLKFEGGILGLAYVGSPRRNSVGGICTPEYFKNGYTLYLNSGLSSSRNHYGQRVITREADLVTAHEFGHNWGSEHDPDIPECSPSASQGGSYLMYTYSVSGYDVNNKRFSPCSLRSIRKVLQAKSGRCFSEPEESFCGNLRVEGDEECDAGLLGTEDNDACCDKDCKLRRSQGAVCSDKNSPCCQNCQYMQAGVKCRDAQYQTCEQESRCTGKQAECPKSPPMPNGTDCQEKGKCRNGKCTPYCETQGLQSCMCDIIENACRRCCRTNMNETCFPVEPMDILPDGTPCIQGFCNKGNCEKTVQDVVERFWDIIEDININKVLLFLRDNIVGTVVLVTALLWIPASCVISFIDRKRRREEIKRREWRNKADLVHPSVARRIVHIRVPRSAQANPIPQSSATNSVIPE